MVGANALARWVDWEDQNSCILFGDRAGSMVLTAGREGEEREEGSKKISTPGKGTVGQDGSYDLMSMNGQKKYSFATREVPNVIQEALDKARVKVEDVNDLLLHQANIRIMEVVGSAANQSTSLERKDGLRLQTACQRRGCEMTSWGSLFDINIYTPKVEYPK